MEEKRASVGAPDQEKGVADYAQEYLEENNVHH